MANNKKCRGPADYDKFRRVHDFLFFFKNIREKEEAKLGKF